MRNLIFAWLTICTLSAGCDKKNNPSSGSMNTGNPTTTKSSAKAIISLSFTGVAVNPVIDSNSKTIAVSFPTGLDITKLQPIITLSAKATSLPASGSTIDFSVAQTFTVTAEDGSTQAYRYTPTLPASSAKDAPIAPMHLGIYYAWPSAVNGSNGDINSAISVFKNFDILVFGDGLWKTAHGDHAKTQQIISGLKSINPAIRIYGYIDVGVSTQNLPIATLTQAIDNWASMGVTGVFGDDFGYDFNVTRTRQNLFIDYAHGKGLSVFANSWSVDDALGGSDCHLGISDFYLLESFLVGQGNYRSLDEFKSRGDKAYFYMKTKKVGIAAVSTLSAVNAGSAQSNQFLMGWMGTAMYNFDAFQFTDTYHSASSGQLYLYANPLSGYGSKWKQYDWVEKVSANSYRRSTDIYTLVITGDGSTTGTGSFTKP